MKFRNLEWAIAEWGKKYALANAVGMAESRLSRCLFGRAQFTPGERAAIARILGFEERWLFRKSTLPARKRIAGEIEAIANA